MTTVERVNRIVETRVTGPSRDVLRRELILWRMSPAEIKAARRGIDFLLSQGHYQPDVAGELLAISHQALSELGVKSLTRRALLKRGLTLGGITAGGLAGLWGISAACEDAFGPAATARKKAEREVYYKDLEANRLLGTIASQSSYTNWSVRYATIEESRRLDDTQLKSRPFSNDHGVRLPSTILGETEYAGIRINKYVRTSDGAPVGKITVEKQGIKTIAAEYVLRSESTETIDASILVFENKINERAYSFRLRRYPATESDRSLFQLTMLQNKK